MPVMPATLLSISAPPAAIQAPAVTDLLGFANILEGEVATMTPVAKIPVEVTVVPPVVPAINVVTVLDLSPVDTAMRQGKATVEPGVSEQPLSDTPPETDAGLLLVAAVPLLPVQQQPLTAVAPPIASVPAKVDLPRLTPSHHATRAATDRSANATPADAVIPAAPTEHPVPEVPPAASVQATPFHPGTFQPTTEIRQGQPIAAPSAQSAPVQQLFEALARRDTVDGQWLDTVIRDVSVAASKTGDVRFRVEPDRMGGITIERTADRLEIGVSEARSLAVVEAARPQILAGALALGVPVSASSVVHDQSGFRHREDARPRQQIEHRQAEDDGEDAASDAARYA
ncbi:hypothetical protein BH09PSE3_BH09PSE3_09690 [soil metagenome]